MSQEFMPTTGGPDVLPNPVPETDPELPKPDPTPEPTPVPPLPEPAPTFSFFGHMHECLCAGFWFCNHLSMAMATRRH
jgi:hypothetical protein